MRYFRTEKYLFKNVCVGGGGFVSGIVFHPTKKDLVYLRTDIGGIYKRTGPNKKWVCLTDMFGKDESFFNGVLSIALVDNDYSKIYMMCGKYTDMKSPYGRLYYSDDCGLTWKWNWLPFKVGSNEMGRGMGERLAAYPRDPNILFAGSCNNGLWKSADMGRTWKKIKNFPSKDINFLLFDRSPDGFLFVATADGNVYVSGDCGMQWRKIKNSPAGMAYRADVSEEGRIYFTFNDSKGPWGIKSGSVWIYDFKKDRWHCLKASHGKGGFVGISIFPGNPDYLLVSTICRHDEDEIFFSHDGGKTFKAILKNSVFKSFAPYTKTLVPHWITDIKINPFDPKNVIWVTGYGIWETFNFFSKKITWHFSNYGIEETVPMQIINPAKSKVRLVSVMGDIDGFIHNDLDKSPAKRHTPIKKTTLAIDYAGLKPWLFVKAYDTANPFGAYSRNSGRIWIDFKSCPFGTLSGGVKSIAVSADGHSIVWAPRNAAVSYSFDYGNFWFMSKGGVPDGYWVVSEKVLPGIFYIYDGKKGLLWKSLDGGKNFFVANSKLPNGKTKPQNDGMIDYEIKCVDGRKNDLWLAAGDDGLFYSGDGGGNFRKISHVKEAYRIGFGKPEKNANYPVIFIWGRIGSEEGFFKSLDFAKNWIRINDEKSRFGWIHCITGDFRAFGRFYFSTEGRGIIYGEMK